MEKPQTVPDVKIGWVVSDIPVTDTKKLIHSSFSKHSPFTFKLTNRERNKHLYFALRWESKSKEKCP
ncbi:MAG: hypothetical protein LBL94_11355 [Prevotellaceae bacterium]|jgi:hypothetical protein|nr:hypothetical protein [Prevotellaceae bacterium]